MVARRIFKKLVRPTMWEIVYVTHVIRFWGVIFLSVVAFRIFLLWLTTLG